MKILIFSCVSIFGIVNSLECLNNKTNHVKCSDSDYCIYFWGTLNNTFNEYQGCNNNFIAENGSTLCTGDRYSMGIANNNKFVLQCCDTDNCNTGNYTPSSNNNLTCLGTSDNDELKHVKCASNDSYCAYVAGMDEDGKYEKFQGCSADFGEIICTTNEYTNITNGEESYTLQCCDTNNCNTGKNDNGGNDGRSNKINFYLEFAQTFIFLNYVVFIHL